MESFYRINGRTRFPVHSVERRYIEPVSLQLVAIVSKQDACARSEGNDGLGVFNIGLLALVELIDHKTHSIRSIRFFIHIGSMP